MNEITRTRRNLWIGASKEINLEGLLSKKAFNISVDKSSDNPYEKIYEQSKLLNANIAVVEEENALLIKGTFYSGPKLDFCNADTLMNKEGNKRYRGCILNITNNKYTLIKKF